MKAVLPVVLVRLASGLSRQLSASLRHLAPFLIEGIVRRTRAGRDRSGRSHTGRAGRYADARSGRTVDLHQTGAMLSSVRPVITAHGIRLGFSDPVQERKAARHQHGTKRLPKRAFFGLDPNQKVRIRSELRSVIRKLID